MRYAEIIDEQQHVWIAVSARDASKILVYGISSKEILSSSPEKARTIYRKSRDLHNNEDLHDNEVILEFKVVNPDSVQQTRDGIKIKNKTALSFYRVYSGVIDDALTDEIEHDNIDEVALFGLSRCTAVTCNAILKRFVKQPILLGDVPETDVGVLEILTAHGLAYKPVPNAVGRTIQQFAAFNQRNVFYLVTPGHAMALVDGELFDAENRGLDGRRIVAAYLITPR